ncbi:MAG: carbohydrate kinase family protein [Candidatus Gastranaerophilales bacterium]|nr:carbohydrate kinase family protein [Candidatus Gastranaerophilales bacterium]
MKKVFTIGSATMDVFVESDVANIVSVSSPDRNSEFMSYPYGSKIDMTNFSTNLGGGGVNTAMNFDKLGFDTSAIFKIGDDIYSSGILEAFKQTGVKLDNIIQDPSLSTGFSIILVSFQGDRTVLANRGANALIKIEDINYEALKDSDWLYIAPLNGESNKVLEHLVNFAHYNDIKVCFNAGTTSIKQGFSYMKKILATSHVVVMNKEEASMCSGIQVRPDTKLEHYSHELIHPDVVEMLKTLKVAEYQVIVITDGKRGAYAYDGKKFYHCPVFPSDVVSTLGAGDAFASTFFASLARTDKNVGKSLMYGSIASASVVSKFGATEGLITFEEIEKRLAQTPDYTYTEV